MLTLRMPSAQVKMRPFRLLFGAVACGSAAIGYSFLQKVLAGSLILQHSTRGYKDTIASVQRDMIDALALVDQAVQALRVLNHPGAIDRAHLGVQARDAL